ncbi:MAG: diheme cytochrome c [Pseudomonadota bacterium]
MKNAILILLGLYAGGAWAGHDEFTPSAAAAKDPAHAAWREECGSCHVAYPPQLLPAASWRQLMANLERHFGTDASLDPARRQVLLDHALRHAGRQRVDPAAPLSISKSPWFVHEHDELGAAVWRRPAVKSPANCQACHSRAEQGDFGERGIRVPR